jgi:hypothetical protein
MDQLHVNFRLKYVTLIVGAVVTFGVACFLASRSQPSSLPDLLIPAITAGIAITALIYTAINSEFTSRVHMEQLRVTKLDKAMSFIEKSSSLEMAKAVHVGVALRDEVKGKNLDQINAILAASSEKYESLIIIFNYFERMGILVRFDAADESALREYYRAAVIRYWHSFQVWIEDKRNVFQDQDLFHEFETLVKKWK